MKKFVFLIGAAKSGTTKLADMLSQHSEICMSSPKESNYFTPRIFKTRNDKWYEDLFVDKCATYRLDASTSYSAGWQELGQQIPRSIFEFSPQANIIYMVREPVSRAWSSYWHSVRMGVEKRSPKEALSDSKSTHIQASLYNQRINEYKNYFPERQIHIINFEEFIKQPQATTNLLLEQLSLTTIDFSTEEAKSSINTSYRWSGIFIIGKYLPLRYLKAINTSLKKTLPQPIHARIKKLTTKPIPSIPSDIHELILAQLKDDYATFQATYGKD